MPISENTHSNIETDDQKIIKTAVLRFPTKDLQKTHSKVRVFSEKYEGFIQNENSGKSYNEEFRNITLRIPSRHFQTFLDSVSSGVEYFDVNDVSRKDVSEEYVDLEARLKAKRELEKRYLELLSKAKNVDDMLQIERELSKIREEIEARQARLIYLQNQVSYSTVQMYFYKNITDRGVTNSYGDKMWNAIKSGWNGISLFLLGLLHVWPFFVILLIGVVGFKKYIRRKNKNK